MKKIILLVSALFLLIACEKQEKADILVVNANIYTVDDSFSKAEAVAIKGGKFIAVGTTAELKKKYVAEKTIDAEGKTIVPGLIDAHCHFYGLGL